MLYKKESERARKCAIRYLAYRDRSQNEMTRYLKKKMFSTNSVDETITFLENNDYINDARFALQFGRSRIENKKVGKQRLEREFKDKGLAKQIIDETLHFLYEEYDERRIAIDCAKKKINTSKIHNIEKERGRLAKFLERRGFSTGLIYHVVNQLVPREYNEYLGTLSSNKKQHNKSVFSRRQD